MHFTKVLWQNIKSNRKWIQPTGYDTGIKVYNCILKEKVPLVVKNKDFVTWYTCGPTVYDSTHLGHASCYVKLDIIQRILRSYFKINLVTVMNITDVDDKIIAKSMETNKSPIEIARVYERDFWKDLEILNIVKPNIVVRVTENMGLITNYIQKLIDKKLAYEAADHSVYFHVDAFPGYGKLVSVQDNDASTNNELANNDTVKKSPMDFALWKAAKPDEVFWDSKFGPGRPGWHIECSTLASTILGSSIDIHAGGLDLKFPHHENEEAQSCAYFGTEQWVNYWLHTGQLSLRDTKMSKSLKNTVAISDFFQTADPEDFRMACLLSNYRNNMEFNREFLMGAKMLLKSYKFFIGTCNAFIKGEIKTSVDAEALLGALQTCNEEIDTALKDDFDTASAIKSVNALINLTNKMLNEKNLVQEDRSKNEDNLEVSNGSKDVTGLKSIAPVIAVLNFVVDLLDKFGINLNERQEHTGANEIIDILVDFRKDVRNLALGSKDKEMLKLCDKVREELKLCNITLNDHGKASSWSY